MLALDDPRWQELASTYGDGRAVARWLARARAGEPLDDWYDPLFQELLHQYTLSEAAYAAIPHLVDIARQRPETAKYLVVLAGQCYAHAGEADAPEIPPDLEDGWQAALRAAVPVLLEVLREPGLGEGDVRYLLSSLAALKGYAALATAIEALG
jgi:hypothetical protein